MLSLYMGRGVPDVTAGAERASGVPVMGLSCGKIEVPAFERLRVRFGFRAWRVVGGVIGQR